MMHIIDRHSLTHALQVQGFYMGPPRAPQQQPAAASTPQSRRISAAESQLPPAAAAFPAHFSAAAQLHDAADASNDFTDMFVSMLRRYSRHPNAPDVFATLLLSQENPEEKESPCVKVRQAPKIITINP